MFYISYSVRAGCNSELKETKATVVAGDISDDVSVEADLIARTSSRHSSPQKKVTILNQDSLVLTENEVIDSGDMFSEKFEKNGETLEEKPEEKSEEMDLEWIKENLNLYYTDEEIHQTALVVQGEDLMAHSQTVWSAHVWVILGRVGTTGFAQNDSIIGILSAEGQFDAYTDDNLAMEVDPEVEWIVRDVFARKILEDRGASEEVVGRTMPATHLFLKAGGGLYNVFYRYCWDDIYDPFDSPYNPYDN